MTDYHFSYMRKMREAYKKWDGGGCSPYKFDPTANFPMTKIEENMWHDLRASCFPTFYYQFPIGPYYADFCDPFNGIVLEVDGKIHDGLKERDAKRDEYIELLGFTVVRFPGRETFDKDMEDEYGNAYRSAGAIKELGAIYEYCGFSRLMPDQMPWERFRDWKESIGVKADKEAYDKDTRMCEEIDALPGEIISLADVAKIMEKYERV